MAFSSNRSQWFPQSLWVSRARGQTRFLIFAVGHMASSVVESSVETVTLGGDRWQSVGEYPRLIAESFRRLLERYGVPSMIRTPFQWVQSTPVIEIETGGYMGMVQMFVPESMYADAMHVLEGQTTDADAHELDEIADMNTSDPSSKL
jgi:hypothetical protein